MKNVPNAWDLIVFTLTVSKASKKEVLLLKCK